MKNKLFIFVSAFSIQCAFASWTSQILDIAANSSCATRKVWPDRGKAPLGYVKGMSLTFARSLCRLSDPNSNIRKPASVMSKANTHIASKDAISWYRDDFDNLGWEIDVAGPDTLRTLYTLGMGLGMAESSGKYCEGYDRSAGPETASEAEAGLFQSSYDSIGATSELRLLYDEYRKDKSRCFLNVFKQGVSACNQPIRGSGAGAEYQQFNKDCPAFAAEYAMVNLRVLRKHYGPINRQEADLSSWCNGMLDSVQTLVLKNQAAVCSEIK